jgi:protein-tyrosine phosphatase
MALYLGSENLVSPEFLDFLDRREVLTLNGSRYLLIEFPPYLSSDVAESAVEKVLEVGLVPVLAHVERYRFLVGKPRRLAEFKQRGCVVQVNAASVIDHKGKGISKTVAPLFDNRLVDLIASDGHDVHSRPPDLEPAYATLSGQFPEASVAAWMWENPARILHDRKVLPAQ